MWQLNYTYCNILSILSPKENYYKHWQSCLVLFNLFLKINIMYPNIQFSRQHFKGESYLSSITSFIKFTQQ